MIYIIIEFIIVASVVVLASKRLASSAEYIEEHSSFNPIFMGLMLALATSLPELVSSLTSISLGNDVTAVSNILGSNAFNLFALFVLNLCFFKRRIFRRVNPATFKTANIALIMYLIFMISFGLEKFIGIELLVPLMHFTITSLVILGLYFYSVVNCKNDDKDIVVSNDKRDLTKTKQQVFVLIIINVIASMILAHTAEDIILHSSLSEGLVGALLIGGATSLPEIITCYALLKNNKYEMAVSSVIGSNTFNFISFTLLDFSTSHSIYLNLNNSIALFSIMGIILSLLVYLSGLATKRFYNLSSIIGIVIYIVGIILSGYIN